ncbi:chromosome partitioning protein [Halanaerobium congolense]|uniref:Sporulation initiation inhibitor protein Soj n=1 Tax=Halanaerobium congolense TaxID=54121 RepID=A0A1I0CE64_9FIRM|nr:ParA family protein [Halanaerobium congolense]PTX14810.1 chromosome partitioning protein [Halanaerobium congolense]SDG17115.1 chromosome partitioning protein [Halanaerobium congolense]SET17672.1 chromosome partitioning protein [Halanaerobium congolense]SFP67636.1 chromosome partitioning protein [Halanaerobium congolense]
MIVIKIISITNQKGGVSKTSTAINIGSSLAELGNKVLLVDVDPQFNMTTGLGFNKKEKNIYKVMKEEIEFHESIYPTNIEPEDWKGEINLIPSNISLANSELEFSREFSRETILKSAFERSKDKIENLGYDYIILDTNPSLGLLTVNAMAIADSLIVPLEPSVFALDGMEQLINVVKLVRKKINKDLEIEGALLTRVDGRTKIADEFYEDLKEVFGNKLFNTVIHQNVKISEAQSEGLPINIYDKKAKGTKEYMDLALELINNGR